MYTRLFRFFAILIVLLSFARMTRAQRDSGPTWTGTWASAPMAVDNGWNCRVFQNVTLREIVRIAIGGTQLRVRFTNEFGVDPLSISDAHIAISDGGSTIYPGTDRKLTFGGKGKVRIPPGAIVLSDVIDLAAPPLSQVAVSFFLPTQVMRTETFHELASQGNYIGMGDLSGATQIPNAEQFSSWYFLEGIDVRADQHSGAIVALGDSITDGYNSTLNANRRWPDILAERLSRVAALGNMSVLNEGISGNRILNDKAGPGLMARLDRDLLSQDGVQYVIVLEGINDLGRLARPQGPADLVTADELEMALKQLVDVAHEHGIRVFGATLLPYRGAGYYSTDGEAARQAVNTWIRTGGIFDGVIDFDKALRDSADPGRIDPKFDSGDHLHPNDEGYMAMANSVGLDIF